MPASPGWLTKTWWGVLKTLAPKKARRDEHLWRAHNDPEYREATLRLMQSRGYRHATTDAPWKTGSFALSADSHANELNLVRLRERSRELGRDDPIASGIFNSLVTNVVGTGISIRTDDTEADELWAELKDSLAPAENVTWGGFQGLLLRRLLEDGEVFVRRVASDADPVWFEIIESDRVQTPADAQPADEEGEIREGIERDGKGRIVAYHIAKRHPHEALTNVKRGPKFTNLVVPRSKEGYERVTVQDCKHLALKSRAGQSRGLPLLHAVLQDIRDLDLLLLASLKRAQVAACLAVFLESPADVGEMFEVTADSFGFKLDEDLEPGMLFKLMPGEEVSTVSPNFALADLDKFVWTLARRIGTSVGLSAQTVMGDHSQGTYSSARVDLVEEGQTYQMLRNLLAVALRWMHKVSMEDAVLRGELDAVPTKRRVLNPKKDWIDPKSQMEANQIALALKLTSRKRIAEEKGENWDEILDELADEEAQLRDRLEPDEDGGPPNALSRT